MKTPSQYKSVFAFLLFTSTALYGCGGASTDSSQQPGQTPTQESTEIATEPVFIDANEEGMQMEQANPVSDEDAASTRRRRYVRINGNSLKKLAEKAAIGQTVETTGTFKLNVFEDESILISLESIEKVSENNIIFTGKVAGQEYSAATLVVNDGVLIANIRKAEAMESYEVRFTGSKGLHSVAIKLDEAEDECPAEDAGEGPVAVGGEDNGQDSPLAESPVVDILAAYTPNARSKQGGTEGIKALIQLGIADTNAALKDSGSPMRVRLVGTMALKQNETGAWSSDLGKLAGKSDGRWDEVHAERSRLGADQVSLVGSYSNGGSVNGIGYINAGASKAFTVTKSSAFRVYTFSHELGHNLGLNHSDGYVNSSGRFRTIIAYGSYPRIRRYSNPSMKYNGYTTGTSSKNEIRIINANDTRLASLFAQKVSGTAEALATEENVAPAGMTEMETVPNENETRSEEMTSEEMAADQE